jgi:hypothetical protein
MNDAWSSFEAAEQKLTFEEILFPTEWLQALVVKVLRKLIDRHREVDRARNQECP